MCIYESHHHKSHSFGYFNSMSLLIVCAFILAKPDHRWYRLDIQMLVDTSKLNLKNFIDEFWPNLPTEMN